MVTPEILSAVTTPFAPSGEVLWDAVAENLARLEPLVDGVFMAGTTGEFLALSDDEHARLAGTAIEQFGADRVVVHVGSPSTYQSLKLAAAAAEHGARRFAVLTPYYLRATPAGTGAHFAALRAALPDAQLYGYLFPDVAITDIAPDQLGPLVDAGLNGLKLSGLASTRVAAYRESAPTDWRIWSGNDADLPNVLSVGGVGTVSGVSGVCPEPWAAFRDAVAANDEQARDRAQQVIEQLVPALGPSIANLKHGLAFQGYATGGCRMVIDEPTDATRAAIESAIQHSQQTYRPAGV